MIEKHHTLKEEDLIIKYIPDVFRYIVGYFFESSEGKFFGDWVTVAGQLTPAMKKEITQIFQNQIEAGSPEIKNKKEFMENFK